MTTIAGLIITRNSETLLSRCLDNLASYCDSIYVFDDRSQDNTARIARAHSAVGGVFSASASFPQTPWLFPESACLNVLYRAVDLHPSDWVIRLDDDMYLEPASGLRPALEAIEVSVSGVRVPIVSTWNDPLYPKMIPLMSRGRSMNGAIWRYHPGLQPGSQPLHNQRLPANIENFGSVIRLDSPTIIHTGWSTLETRIERVDRYTSLDPECKYNQGVSYDKGLLFGYSRNAVDDLIRDYHARLRED